MNLNLSARATPATRIRLVYRISAGGYSGLSGAQRAADAITTTWRNPGVPAYLVTAGATAAAPGGSTGAGAVGVLAALTGRTDYFSAVDVKTDLQLATMTWAQLLSKVERIPLPGLLGLDVRVDLDHAESLAVSAADVSPSALQRSAADTANQSRAGSAPAQLADLLNTTGKRIGALLLIAVVLVAAVKLLPSRTS